MFIRSMMNDEFECDHCASLFRNLGAAQAAEIRHVGESGTTRLAEAVLHFRVTLGRKQPYRYGDRMATALEWVIDTMLDEMDKILRRTKASFARA